MQLLLVQPPFVQLNAPYPAVHYLAAWLRAQGHQVELEDHSIELYRLLFSREGLGKLFDEVEARAAAGLLPPGSSEQVERYLSYRELYRAWIGPVVDWLSGSDPAFAHRLAAAAEFPRGARVEAFLESRGGRPGPEDASLLASLILKDLGDLVTQVVDADFGTIQYGERLGRSRDDLGEVRASLESSWLMKELYRPWVRRRFGARKTSVPKIVLISLPFPGTLAGALACSSEARATFGAETPIVFGGGYVSTELRGLRDPAFFDFCDFLCFDAGYAGLVPILAARNSGSSAVGSLYRTMYRREGRIVVAGFPEGDLAASEEGCAGEKSALPSRLVMTIDPAQAVAAARVEARALRESHPDYRDFEPSKYLRPLDSTNPMHRLWSESPWLKYRLAQGCYWKRCSFCDTELDYVRDYVNAELTPLLVAMDKAAASTGLRGIHFVDEALPMARLLAFAEENRRRMADGRPVFHYWGNVRFDASWTPERIELLAFSGLVAVSGGIEVATEKGLAMTDKGFDLAGLVRTLVAFRRAGILVHAYLIYGFPGQDEADIVESADFVRGLFATGLVDSAFWHRFVLTRHSRMLAEWRQGGHPELRPIDRGGTFAANDLEFEGEKDFDRYGEGLDAALGAWMEGEGLDRPAALWLDIAQASSKHRDGKSSPAKSPSTGSLHAKPLNSASDGIARVEALIAEAEAALDARPLPQQGRAYWIAGLPSTARERPAVRTGGRGGAESSGPLRWAFRGEILSHDLGTRRRAEAAQSAITRLAALAEGMDLREFVEKSGLAKEEIAEFLDFGLVLL
ncbi:MAG TPA: radical SAM protein [Rectinemataceae bacterium]|nr:radical SAM protein [Rectinemataceae bacterium]